MNFFKSKEAKAQQAAAASEKSPTKSEGEPILSPRGHPSSAVAQAMHHHASHGELVNELRKRGLTGSAGSNSSDHVGSAIPQVRSGLSASSPTLPSCPPSPPTPHLPNSPPESPRSAPTTAPNTPSPLAKSLPSPRAGALAHKRPPPPVPLSPKPALVPGVRSPPQVASPSSSPHSSSYNTSPAPSPSGSLIMSSSGSSPTRLVQSPPSGGSPMTSPSSSMYSPLVSPPNETGVLPPVSSAYPPPPPPPRKPLLAYPTMVMLPRTSDVNSPTVSSEFITSSSPTTQNQATLGSSVSFPSPSSPSGSRKRSNTGDPATVRKNLVTPFNPRPSPASSPASTSPGKIPLIQRALPVSPAPLLHSSGGSPLPPSPRGMQLPPLERSASEDIPEAQVSFDEDPKKKEKNRGMKDKLLKRTVSEKNVPQANVTVNPLMAMVSPRTTKKPGLFGSGAHERMRKGTEIAGMTIRRMDERKERNNSASDGASPLVTDRKPPPAIPPRRLTDDGIPIGAQDAADPLALAQLSGTAGAVVSAVVNAVPPTPLTPAELRQLVVNELIHTEKSYCRDLNVIIEVWMKPLRSQGIFTPEDASIVFSNVEQLRMLNEELLISLQGVEDKPAQEQDVGYRFSRFVDFLKMYSEYCAHQAGAIERLQELRKCKPHIQQVLDETKNRPECNLLDLESYLIKPLQRVTKYPLLLKEILKNTEDSHPDYPALDKCYSRIAEVVLEINEKKRQSENVVKLIQLQNNFITNSEEEQLKLISPHRRLVEHGVFKKVFIGTKAPIKIKNCHLFLFNDMLLVASEEGNMFKKTKKFLLRGGPIAITNVLLWSGNDPEGLMFCIVRMDDNSGQITIQANSQEEKFEWITRINDCIVNLPNSGLRGGPLKDVVEGVEKFSRSK